MTRHIILIDNHDSFTFNLVYDLESLGARVHVYRNTVDAGFLLQRAATLRAGFVISPGPGTPRDAGVSIELVRRAAGRFGVLGVCLGHQAIVEAFGGSVGRSPEAVHGRASRVRFEPHPLFAGLPQAPAAARYHSLVAERIPAELDVIARTGELVMAIAHRAHRIAGLQFHPESILTAGGRCLLENALAWIHDDEKEHDHAALA